MRLSSGNYIHVEVSVIEHGKLCPYSPFSSCLARFQVLLPTPIIFTPTSFEKYYFQVLLLFVLHLFNSVKLYHCACRKPWWFNKEQGLMGLASRKNKQETSDKSNERGAKEQGQPVAQKVKIVYVFSICGPIIYVITYSY